MKILVISDSHGNKQNLKEALDVDEFDKIIFAGDGIKDLLELEVPKDKLILVKGNNDITNAIPKDVVVELENKRFFITHGDQYNVSMGLKKLIERAEQANADIVIYGHTHISAQLELDSGLILINPGSIGKGKLKQNTFAILEIDAENNVFDCFMCQIG